MTQQGSRQALRAAKRVAEEVLGPEWVLPLFREYLSGRYGCPPDRVVFDYKDACRRIREAVYLTHAETSERVEEINGETDGDTIWLMRRLDDQLLLNTLLHEALHDSVFVERVTRSGGRRTLSESDEHAIMDIVGLLADD